MGIELPRYNKCCYCIPLKIGVLIIGYVSIIASCVTLGTISYSIFRVSEFVKNNNDRPNPQHPPGDVSKAALGLYITFAYYLLVFLFSFTISLVLVIGAHTGKPSYLRFYFKATMFLFALSIVLVVVTFVFMGFIATLPVLKWSFTLLVCMIMVRSYYLILEEREKPTVYELQPYVPVQVVHQGQQPLMA
ncbi:hypothetical protein PYW07_012060 [Mythimna separata]|uniref:Uncharacterized protein n=1 Tax=Mythimna separata TaxID=271217 RepID=A0AAD7YMN0_MYTSE|nr:hypothetical protein PYW07_012060 [Mythimna separata]